MSNTQSRMGDMSDAMLVISHREDDTIEVSIDRLNQAVTFTRCGGESFKTCYALMEVLKAIQKDNQEYPQEGNLSEGKYQERIEDKEDHPNRLFAWYYGDIKIEIPFALNPLEFKSPENGGKSPHTHEALIKALNEIEKDNAEYSQARRINDRKPEDPAEREMIKRILDRQQ